MALFQHESISQASLQHIVDHVFLPPKLPQSAKESSVALHDGYLLEALIQSLQSCGQNLDASEQEAVQGLHMMMTELRRVRSEMGAINEDSLLSALQDLLAKGRPSQPTWQLLTSSSRRQLATSCYCSECRSSSQQT